MCTTTLRSNLWTPGSLLPEWPKISRVLTIEVVQVGGADGIRLTDQTLLAPNSFYYVARGPFVYRLTPLGGLSSEMLETVLFTR
jgi:hypothetical protein